MFSKLVLFDIDGTIIAHAGTIVRAVSRYDFAIKAAYGVDCVFDIQKYNGFIERSIVWDLIKDTGITRQEFLDKFSSYVDHLHTSLVELEKEGALYVTIPDAVTLVDTLSQRSDIALGVITGNAKRIAEWKLEKTNLAKYFSFGLYGDEADDRIELAGMVFEKAKAYFGQAFESKDIVVIGDTIHDIRAGKAIGAYTIAVTTGLHGPNDELAATEPDLLVDSLLDRKILTFFGLAEQ
jgi:phosphoglycolate phosphatase